MLRYLPVLICALLLTACGTSQSQSGAQSLTLDEALAQVDALQPQPGTDRDDFARLKAGLRRSLEVSGVTRFTSATPGGAAGTVSDLVFSTGTQLTWTYANRADYDQNRQVNIADLSTLGANLGKGSASPDWLAKARVADGDGNGLITISDITPLGASLLASVDGYWVQSSTTPSDAGSWSDLGQVHFEDATLEDGNPFKRFAFDVDSPQTGTYYRVRPYNGEELGPVSNYVQLGDGPPGITDVQPQGGAPGAVVQFSATLDGSPVTDYAWDFGGGAVPNTTIDPSPTVTLGAAGSYSASLTVTGDLGSDTYDFTLNVGTAVTPPHIDDVQPRSGYGNGGSVTFSATLSGGAPDTYSWDFGAPGGEITPNISSDPAPQVLLGALGAYNASLTVGNAGGSDTFNFVFNITQMPDPMPRPYYVVATDGEYPDHVTLTWQPDPLGPTPDSYDVIRTLPDYTDFVDLGTTTQLTMDDPTASPNQPYLYQVYADKAGYSESGPAGDFGWAYQALPAAWHTNTIPGVTDQTSSELFLVDANGKPGIGRHGNNPTTYAEWIKAQDVEGSNWDAPQEMSDGTHGFLVDMSLVFGWPTMLMKNDYGPLFGTYFRGALDADGSTWDNIYQVSQGAFTGSPRLVDLNGWPGITYGSAGVYFIKASDILGTTWPSSGAQIGSNSTGVRAAYLPDYRPILSTTWEDAGTVYVQTLTATDLDGLAWTPSNVCLGNLGNYLSSQAVFYSAGRPWLGVERRIGANPAAGIMFANDADGTSWPASETPIPTATNYNDVRFAVINGRPCAITVVGSAGAMSLGFFEAQDNLGTAWKAPETVISNSPAISFPCLTGIGMPQRPAVAAYSGAPNWSIVFAEKY